VERGGWTCAGEEAVDLGGDERVPPAGAARHGRGPRAAAFTLSRSCAWSLAIVGWGWKTTKDDEASANRAKSKQRVGKGRRKIGESCTAVLINKTMVTNYSFHFKNINRR
jgi:hypothetical protein